MIKPRTGLFHLFTEADSGASEACKDHKRLRLLNEMACRVAAIVLDGRKYELVARVGLWEPGDWLPIERLRLDFSLVLLDPSAAEVGDWVKGLNREVPDDAHFISFGEGSGEMPEWRFQRGCLGWCRIE